VFELIKKGKACLPMEGLPAGRQVPAMSYNEILIISSMALKRMAIKKAKSRP